MKWNRLITCTALAAMCALFCAGNAAASDEEARGRELFNSLGCKGCHKIDGSGGAIGPALDGVGKRLEDKKIREQLLKGGAGMPSYQHLPEEDLDALVDYLEDL